MSTNNIQFDFKKGYKLFRRKSSEPGKLFPLFVFPNEIIETLRWLEAKPGPLKENGKVKSKLGDLAYRPGWHINENVPYVNHIGKRDKNGKIAFLPDEYVWCEVYYETTINYQEEADKNGLNRKGIVVPKKAYLKYVPEHGYYRYKTNANQIEPWIISGNIFIVRELADKEVEYLCSKYGLQALPRLQK